MKCSNCSFESAHDFKFCPSCGKSQLASATATPPTPPAQPVPPPVPPAPPTQAAPPPVPPAPPTQAAPYPVPPTQAGPDSGRQAYVRNDYNPAQDGKTPVSQQTGYVGTAGGSQPQGYQPPYSQPAQPIGYTNQPQYGQSSQQPPRYTNQPPYATPVQPQGGQTYQPAAQPPYGQAPAKPSTTGQVVMGVINILCCGFGISAILGIVAIVFAATSQSETNLVEARNKIKIAKVLNIIGLVIIGISILLFVVLLIALPSAIVSFFEQFDRFGGYDY